MEARARGIQSVEIAAAVLDVVAEHRGPLRQRDIAARTGLAANKLRPYLVSLMRVGLLCQHEDSRYAVGPKALHLGVLALDADNLFSAAQSQTTQLCQETGQAVLLSVWDRDHPVIVAQADNGTLPMAFRIGKATPLSTATGNVFMAHLPTARDTGRTPQVPALPEDLDARLETVRRDGLARAEVLKIDRGVTITGYGAVAAPVFSSSGALTFVMTLMIPAHIESAQRQAHEAALLRAARQLSRQGWESST